MKHLNLSLSLVLLVGSFFVSQQLISNSRSNQRNKSDYAELNSVKYGLFNIDAWKDQLVSIISDEFDDLYVSNETEQELREHVAVVLNKMIDEAAAKIETANKKSAAGKMKQAFMNMFVDVKDIKKGIPEYTEAVIKELKKPKTKKQIQTIVNNQLTEFATKTADKLDHTRIKSILTDVDAKDVEDARAKLEAKIAATHHLIINQSAILISIGACLFALFAFSNGKNPAQFVILVLSLVSLLASGVATPMIDMEAKISQLKFLLIGHPILFENQVLYFQSKSILDVFWLMITDDQIQMKIVGVLVVSFSVVFPLLKLISTVIYYFDFRGAKDVGIIKFFVHKSGKWSMADVMVVAIFMAYIGFNGVINSQLKDLNFPDSGVDVIATNGTSLQPGYYVFLTYVLVALLMSGYLTQKISQKTRA